MQANLQRLIKSVVLLPILAIIVSGCSTIDPIEIDKKPSERARLDIQQPPPLDLKETSWIIITPQNSQDVWSMLEQRGDDMVLFGLTDKGYETMSVNLAEIVNFIARQRKIIELYQEYYEPVNADSK